MLAVSGAYGRRPKTGLCRVERVGHATLPNAVRRPAAEAAAGRLGRRLCTPRRGAVLPSRVRPPWSTRAKRAKSRAGRRPAPSGLSASCGTPTSGPPHASHSLWEAHRLWDPLTCVWGCGQPTKQGPQSPSGDFLGRLYGSLPHSVGLPHVTAVGIPALPARDHGGERGSPVRQVRTSTEASSRLPALGSS